MVIWCGDFNAHSVTWGSSNTDKNGTVVEEYMEDKFLVCLNDGSGTRFNIRDLSKSCLDLTIVSAIIAVKCQWEILDHSTIGSDHYPISCTVGLEMQRCVVTIQQRWKFERADWEKYNDLCKTELMSYSMENDTDECTEKLRAAEESIPKSKRTRKDKVVPWWNSECSNAIKSRNKAFRKLKRTLIPEAIQEYQKERAKARRIIKQAKKRYWQGYCSSIGKETELGEVWGRLKKMIGIYKTRNITGEGRTAITEKDKAEILVKTLQKADSKENLDGNYRRKRKEILMQNLYILIKCLMGVEL